MLGLAGHPAFDEPKHFLNPGGITDHGHEQHALPAPSKPLIFNEIMLVEKSFHRIDPGLAWLELTCSKSVEDKATERPTPALGITINIGGAREQVGLYLRPKARKRDEEGKRETEREKLR